MTLEQVMEVIEQAWKEHKEVVRLHTGRSMHLRSYQRADGCYGQVRDQV